MDQTFVKRISDSNYEVYHVIPRDTTRICFKGSLESSLISAFPPHLNSFKYAGKQIIGNTTCDAFNYNSPVQGATNNYTFYVAPNGVPVQFNYIGFSSSIAGYLHSPNYDWFVSNYTRYIPNYYNASDFDLPSICNTVTPTKVMSPSQRMSHMFHFDVDQMFAEFVSQHGKVYKSKEEYNLRKKIYIDNLSKISSHRWEYNSGKHSHTLGVNWFADKTKEEVKSSCYRKDEKLFQKKLQDKKIYHQKSSSAVPTSIDWREKGAVSPIKDQGDCGSCWSFSATGAVESAHFIKNSRMVTASEQYLLDCTWEVSNAACNGGWPFASYDYVLKHNNASWPSEKDYRYLMNPSICKSVAGEITLLDYKKITQFDEAGLTDAVGNFGPVSVCVDSTNWTFYHSGIFDDKTCSSNPNDIDHCVLAVGYGSENGKDYWIIKNQWSQHWGEQGYMRLAKGENRCGVADDASYPIVAIF
eukprot:TRINITY_DN698_c0_g1_i1.p1 TRINITY_DN698_c0_g1~~TRINITY_DN698_c0_g1_i1.p1  ORF type:complete len:537 (+),score=116.43 TRINITY_DN698_c0_g1_i1:204-1613(+)